MYQSSSKVKLLILTDKCYYIKSGTFHDRLLFTPYNHSTWHTYIIGVKCTNIV